MTSSPKKKFGDQKRRAAQRGIEWNLTFDEWWQFWQDSGHWEERGTHRGQYVMSRYNDIGPYQLNNIFTQTVENNLSEGNLGKIKLGCRKSRKPLSEETKQKMRGPRGPLGYKRKTGPRGPYKKTIEREMA